MKKRIFRIVIGVAAFLVFITVQEMMYIVDETEQSVITQFGKPVGQPIVNPGLYVKIPFIQTVNRFDKRYLEWDGSPNQVPTKDKKFIFVDTYARWQITDPLQFFKRFRDERGAQSRLDDILDGETRSAVAKHDLLELIRSTNRVALRDEILSEVISDTLKNIDRGREFIQEDIKNLANERVTDLGIAILDFRFKRINYVQEVRKTVYDRMISERNRIADKFRSEGEGESSRINGEKDRELNAIQSEAFKKAEEIRGRADAEAASIYTDAYNKNNQSRDFYSFLKTLESYRTAIDNNTTIILSTDSEFYKLLQGLDQK